MELKVVENIERRKSVAVDKTFLTDGIKTAKEPDQEDKINEYYSQLKEQVAKLDVHIDNVLQKHENDFLNAFKCQMFGLYTQLKDLKRKTDENEMKLKRDEQLNKLQTSLDWFREEAVHLGETTQLYKKEADKWKAKADSLEEDRKFLEEQLRCAKLRIKHLQEEKSSTRLENSFTTSRPQTVSASTSHKFVPSSKSGLIVLDLLQKHSLKDGTFFCELEKLLINQEQKFKESLKQIQTNFSEGKKKWQNISSQHASVYFEKSELETIFLDCVEEVRKEISKRKKNNISIQKYSKRAVSSNQIERNVMTSSDKRKILELLVSNEQILVLLYEKLFPHRASQYNSIIKPDESSQEPLPTLEELLKQLPNKTGKIPQYRGRLFT